MNFRPNLCKRKKKNEQEEVLTVELLLEEDLRGGDGQDGAQGENEAHLLSIRRCTTHRMAHEMTANRSERRLIAGGRRCGLRPLGHVAHRPITDRHRLSTNPRTPSGTYASLVA